MNEDTISGAIMAVVIGMIVGILLVSIRGAYTTPALDHSGCLHAGPHPGGRP